jgi:hypothetical protein
VTSSPNPGVDAPDGRIEDRKCPNAEYLRGPSSRHEQPGRQSRWTVLSIGRPQISAATSLKRQLDRLTSAFGTPRPDLNGSFETALSGDGR